MKIWSYHVLPGDSNMRKKSKHEVLIVTWNETSLVLIKNDRSALWDSTVPRRFPWTKWRHHFAARLLPVAQCEIPHFPIPCSSNTIPPGEAPLPTAKSWFSSWVFREWVNGKEMTRVLFRGNCKATSISSGSQTWQWKISIYLGKFHHERTMRPHWNNG